MLETEEFLLGNAVLPWCPVQSVADLKHQNKERGKKKDSHTKQVGQRAYIVVASGVTGNRRQGRDLSFHLKPLKFAFGFLDLDF